MVSFNLQSSCLQSAVCSLRSAVCKCHTPRGDKAIKWVCVYHHGCNNLVRPMKQQTTEWILLIRCFDTVSRRPYRCFSIALKVVLSLSDRNKIFTSDWLWIEVCQNAVFSKIDVTMTTINKKLRNRLNPNFARSKPVTENPRPGT